MKTKTVALLGIGAVVLYVLTQKKSAASAPVGTAPLMQLPSPTPLAAVSCLNPCTPSICI